MGQERELGVNEIALGIVLGLWVFILSLAVVAIIAFATALALHKSL